MLNLTKSQTLTYWAPSSKDAFQVWTFATPVSVMGRWEDHQEMFRDAAGEELMSTTRAFPVSDVAVDGWLYLGTSTESDPADQAGARRIRAFKKVPNRMGNQHFRTAMLT